MRKLPPIKQRIVDIVRRAGPDGIPNDELFAIVYQDKAPPMRSRRGLSAHAYQLRKMGFPIVGQPGRRHQGRFVSFIYTLRAAE